ncbi:NlpC/P60 family protein [Bacterioplanoides pacificum]|uniref:NlpC/P60 family protein n=1 Tax=Bacterioplanoides pacificum TaxID=1171596 RepID=A0ABV7VQT7_9GAMM
MKSVLSACCTLFSAVLLLALTACSSAPTAPAASYRAHYSEPAKAVLSDSAAAKQQLFLQYQQWQGTPHRMGGLTEQGVDCSGFVYRTFQDRFGISLPRTTARQSLTGDVITREQLRAGDLVFFKTGSKLRHVGIYLENSRFMHVSSKRGVMISGLDDYYWKDKFWHARRIEAR